MKIKLTVFVFIAAGMLFAGCGKDIKIGCHNYSSYDLLVTGDATGKVPPGGNDSFTIEKNECLEFTGLTYPAGETVTAKSWGRHCFDQDNSFGFYDDHM